MTRRANQAPAPKLERIALDRVRTDRTQSRAQIDDDAVAEYAAQMEAGDEFPPLVLWHDGSHYWCGDGFHRLLAASRAGLSEYPAEVHLGTWREALRHSLGANVRHGVRRTNADKRHAVMLALQDPEWREMSHRQIAELCGVARSLVAKIRTEVDRRGGEKVNPEDDESGQVYTEYTDEISILRKSSEGGDEGKSPKTIPVKELPSSTGIDFDPPSMDRDDEEDVDAHEKMRIWNLQVDRFASALTGMEREAPEGPWWDESQAAIVSDALRRAAAIVRAVKGRGPCGKCEGGGCARCHRTGFLPRRQYQMEAAGR